MAVTEQDTLKYFVFGALKPSLLATNAPTAA
jgi:hypothetical protein